MAKAKVSKGNVQRFEALAVDRLEAVALPLYALGDFAQKLHKAPLEFNTLQQSVAGLCAKVSEVIENVAQMLPKDHAARNHIERATRALDNLQAFINLADHSPEVEKARPPATFA